MFNDAFRDHGRPHPRTLTRRLAISAAAASLMLVPLGTIDPAAAGTHASPKESSAGSQELKQQLDFVSRNRPSRLIQSTGNLYWTANRFTPSGQWVASVYRTSKQAIPGQERVLFQMAHHGELAFGALAYAKNGSTYYGFVVVNNLLAQTSEILRFPLGGGAGQVLAPSPTYIGQRDLITDGSTLFWADASGLRSISTQGGTLTTLVNGTGIVKVAMGTTHVYYATGTHIRAVRKTGGSIVAVATTDTDVTALFVRPATNSSVYWGESNGSVRSLVFGLPIRHTYQQPTAGKKIRSVASEGSAVVWADCSPSLVCRVAERVSTFTFTLASDQLAVSDIHIDSAAVFWGASAGVLRFRQ
jgi:hypothetical protein